MARQPTDEQNPDADPYADHPAVQVKWGGGLPQALRYAEGWNLQCFAQHLSGLPGDADRLPCSQEDSRQHVFAKFIFEQGFDGRALAIPGARLRIPVDNPGAVAEAMRGWRLCTAHEELFAESNEAGEVFLRTVFALRSVLCVASYNSPFHGMQIDGPVLERWFLKLHCDLLSTRNGFDQGAGLSWVPPPEWLDILAGRREMFSDVGLYFAGIDSDLLSQPQPSIMTRRPMGPWGTEFVIWGLRFAFLMRPSSPPQAWASGYAPRDLVATSEKRAFRLRLEGDKFADGPTFHLNKGLFWPRDDSPRPNEARQGIPVVIDRQSGRITPVFQTPEEAERRETFDRKLQEYRQREDDEYRRVHGKEPPPRMRKGISKEELIAIGAREPDPPADSGLRAAAEGLAADYDVDFARVLALLKHLRTAPLSPAEQTRDPMLLVGIRAYPHLVVSRALAASQRHQYSADSMLRLLESGGRERAYRSFQVLELAKDRLGGLFTTRSELAELMGQFACYLEERRPNLVESGYADSVPTPEGQGPPPPFEGSLYLAGLSVAYPVAPKSDPLRRWFPPEVVERVRQHREPTLSLLIDTLSAAANALEGGTVSSGEFWEEFKGTVQRHLRSLDWAALKEIDEAYKASDAEGMPEQPSAFWNAAAVARHCEFEIGRGLIDKARQWLLDASSRSGGEEYWDLLVSEGAAEVDRMTRALFEDTPRLVRKFSETWDERFQAFLELDLKDPVVAETPTPQQLGHDLGKGNIGRLAPQTRFLMAAVTFFITRERPVDPAAIERMLGIHWDRDDPLQVEFRTEVEDALRGSGIEVDETPINWEARGDDRRIRFRWRKVRGRRMVAESFPIEQRTFPEAVQRAVERVKALASSLNFTT